MSDVVSKQEHPEKDAPFVMQTDGQIALLSSAISQSTIVEKCVVPDVDPLATEAEKFPAYWKPLPPNWRAIDTYRVDVLFPLNDSRLIHARKKLLVCGTRTGGKSIRKDIAEAYATLGQWLAENPEV